MSFLFKKTRYLGLLSFFALLISCPQPQRKVVVKERIVVAPPSQAQSEPKKKPSSVSAADLRLTFGSFVLDEQGVDRPTLWPEWKDAEGKKQEFSAAGFTFSMNPSTVPGLLFDAETGALKVAAADEPWAKLAAMANKPLTVVATKDGQTFRSNFKIKVKVSTKEKLVELINFFAREAENAQEVDFNGIDTSSITNMDRLFYKNSTFNYDISQWDVSNVESMDEMFREATSFSQDIRNWDIRKSETNLKAIFEGADAFEEKFRTVDPQDYFVFFYFLPSLKYGSKESLFSLDEQGKIQALEPQWGSNPAPRGVSFRIKPQIPGLSVVTLANKEGWLQFDSLASFAAANAQEVVITATLGKKSVSAALKLQIVASDHNHLKTIVDAFIKAPGIGTSGNFEAIDTHRVTSMKELFKDNIYFNGKISTWDTSSVSDMSSMFSAAAAFDQDLSQWDTSSVSDMSSMFSGATLFNQDIGQWDTSSVSNMSSMFSAAAAFNQDISNWDTSKVSDMSSMFHSATLFDQPLDGWNVSALNNLDSMFNTASSFNRDISKWNLNPNLRPSVSQVFLNAPAFTSAQSGDGSINANTYFKRLSDTPYFVYPAFEFDAESQNVKPLRLQWIGTPPDEKPRFDYGSLIEGVTISDDGTLSFDSLATFAGLGVETLKITAYENKNYETEVKIQIVAQDEIDLKNIVQAFSSTEGIDEESFAKIDTHLVTNMSGLFKDSSLVNPEIVDWDTSQVTNMSSMFENAQNFKGVIVDWNTSRVTNMSSMFKNAISFNQDISRWDTSQVTNMSSMFENAQNFKGVLGNWDTSQVTNMSSMFKDASDFDQNIGSWNTIRVTNMNSMFKNTRAFNQDISRWELFNLTDMGSMFERAESFNQNIGSWKTLQVTNMSSMFKNAILFNQDISNWELFNVTTAKSMFENARSFNQNIENWHVLRAQNSLEDMFSNAVAFNNAQSQGLPTLPRFYFSLLRPDIALSYGVKDQDGAPLKWFELDEQGKFKILEPQWSEDLPESSNFTFSVTPEIDGLDIDAQGNIRFVSLASFAAAAGQSVQVSAYRQGQTFSAKVELRIIANNKDEDIMSLPNLVKLFRDDKSIGDSGNFNAIDTRKMTSMTSLFQGLINFNGDIGGWDTSSVKDMSFMFFGATNFNRNISNWKTHNAEFMNSMFSGASNFNQDISNWNTSKVTNMNSMFSGATSFNSKLNRWDVSKVNDMSLMFNGAENFDRPLGKWLVSSVQDMGSMFKMAAKFNQDISLWDTSQVQKMNAMFEEASKFNQNISAWKTDALRANPLILQANVASMFTEATAFNKHHKLKEVNALFYFKEFLEGNSFGYGESQDGVFEGLFSLTGNSLAALNPVWDRQPSSGVEYKLNSTALDGLTVDKTTGAISFDNLSNFVQANGQEITVVATVGGVEFKASLPLEIVAQNKIDLQNIIATFVGNSGITNSGNFNAIDTHRITDMSELFQNQPHFNGDISSWDVSKVTNMKSMFANTSAFNKPLNNWDVSNVTNMEAMFSNSVFNQPLNSWNVSKVENMSSMFSNATAFNQDISSWDVSKAWRLSELAKIGGINSMENTMFSGANALTDSNGQNVASPQVYFDVLKFLLPEFSYAPFTLDFAADGTASISRTPTANFSTSVSYSYSPTVTDLSINAASGELSFATLESFAQAKVRTIIVTVTAQQGSFSQTTKVDLKMKVPQNQLGNYVLAFAKAANDAGKATVKLNFLDTGDITDMSELFSFEQQSGLNSLNFKISQWDTSKVTDMSSMFAGLTNFNDDIGNWETSKVTAMRSMFSGASAFNADISNWDVSLVEDMSLMFKGASAFNQNISGWKVSKVWEESQENPNKDISSMFLGADALRTARENSGKILVDEVDSTQSRLDPAKYFTVLLVLPAFSYPSSFALTNAPSYNTVQKLAISWSQTPPNNIQYSFAPQVDGLSIDADGALSFASLYQLSQAAGGKVVVKAEAGVRVQTTEVSLKVVAETRTLQGFVNAFITAATDKGDTTVNLEAIDTSQVSTMVDLFSGKSGLNFKLSSWDTSRVTDMSNMFNGAESFDDDISNWDTSSVTNMEAMFSGASAFQQDLKRVGDRWDTSKVTNMSNMFKDAANFSANISNWDVAAVSKMSDMFNGAAKFSADIRNWKVSTAWASQTANGMSSMLSGSGIQLNGTNPAPETYFTVLNNFSGFSYPTFQLNPAKNNVAPLSLSNEGEGIKYTYAPPINGLSIDQNSGELTFDNLQSFANAEAAQIKVKAKRGQVVKEISVDLKIPVSTENITSHVEAFTTHAKANNLVKLAALDTSKVESMANLFEDKGSLNFKISSWDTSQVTNMSSMFKNAAAFNDDISGWDVSKVKNMNAMFQAAAAFSYQIYDWNVYQAREKMSNIFDGAVKFNELQPHSRYLAANNLATDPQKYFNIFLQQLPEFNYSTSSFVLNGDKDKLRARLLNWKGAPPRANITFTHQEKDSGGEIDGLNIDAQGNISFDSLADFREAGGKTVTISATYTASSPPQEKTAAIVLEIFANDDNIKDLVNAFTLGADTANLNFINTAAVTNMSELFKDKADFNGNISKWITSSVTDMSSMFESASNFNGDITNWDVSSVANMSSMFVNAQAFNGDIKKWDVSRVRDMSLMFQDASNFLTNIAGWNVVAAWSNEKLSDIFPNRSGFDPLQYFDILRNSTATNQVLEIDGEAFSYTGGRVGSLPLSWSDGTTEGTITVLPQLAGLSASFENGIRFNSLDNLAKAAGKTINITATDSNDLTSVVTMKIKVQASNNNIQSLVDNFIASSGDLNFIDTAGVTDMSGLFINKASFNGNLNQWDTSSVTNMSNMFSGAQAFDADIKDWNTSSVTNMSNMFSGAQAFDADIKGWDVAKVKNMDNMFKDAKSFDAEIYNWKVGTSTTYNGMFVGATAFNNSQDGKRVTNSITDPAKYFDTLISALPSFSYGSFVWDNSTKNVQPLAVNWSAAPPHDVEFSFSASTPNGIEINAETGKISITDLATFMSLAKKELTESATSVKVQRTAITGSTPQEKRSDLSFKLEATDNNLKNLVNAFIEIAPDGNFNFINTAAVTNMSELFKDKTSFNGDISQWVTSNVTDMSSMFANAQAFKQNINTNILNGVTFWDTSKVEDMSSMFANAVAFDSEIKDWNTSKVEDMSSMFAAAVAFDSEIKDWNTSKVEDMSSMFAAAAAFNGEIKDWNTSNVKDMSSMFANAVAFDSEIKDWNTSKVEDMSSMFANAQAFKQYINTRTLSGKTFWDTSKVKDMSSMFSGATKFDRKIDNWDVSKVTNMSSMFKGAASFKQNIKNWSVGEAWRNSITDPTDDNDMRFMFRQATTFTQNNSDNPKSYFTVLADFNSFQLQSPDGNDLLFVLNDGKDNVKPVPIVWSAGRPNGVVFSTSSAGTQITEQGGKNWLTFTNLAEFLALIGQEITITATATQNFSTTVTITLKAHDRSSSSNNSILSLVDALMKGDFDDKLNKIDTSQVTDMSSLFSPSRVSSAELSQKFKDFNQPLANWDTSAVNDMSSMFKGTEDFDQDISKWKVQKSADLDDMFSGATKFNQAQNPIRLNEDGHTLPQKYFDSLLENLFPDLKYNALEFSGGQVQPLTINWGDLIPSVSVTFTTTQNDNLSINSQTGTLTFASLAGFLSYYNTQQTLSVKAQSAGEADKTAEIELKIQPSDRNALKAILDSFIAANLNSGNFNFIDTSQVEDMSELFKNQENFNGNIGSWDTSKVTTMREMFNGAIKFKQNIGGWNVENVTSMEKMFQGASAFKQNIGSWNVENVTTMSSMFQNATSFQQHLDAWDVAQVTDMSSMFENAKSFNGNIDNWEVSNVTNMSSMFAKAQIFNRDISGWDVSKVTDMSSMFNAAADFQQDISNWDVSAVQDFSDMEDNSPFTNDPSLYFTVFKDVANSFEYSQFVWDKDGKTVQPFAVNWKKKLPVTTHFSLVYPAGLSAIAGLSLNQKTAQLSLNNSAFMQAFNQGIQVTLKFYQANGSLVGTRAKTLPLPLETIKANDSNIASLVSTFIAAQADGNFNVIDTSAVTSMKELFKDKTTFNGNISNWNVEKVTTMSSMFQGASAFNQNIGSWKVGEVTNMEKMFQGASAFNQNIGSWNVENVTTMREMFKGTAQKLSHSIRSWKVEKVLNGGFADMFDSNYPASQVQDPQKYFNVFFDTVVTPLKYKGTFKLNADRTNIEPLVLDWKEGSRPVGAQFSLPNTLSSDNKQRVQLDSETGELSFPSFKAFSDLASSLPTLQISTTSRNFSSATVNLRIAVKDKRQLARWVDVAFKNATFNLNFLDTSQVTNMSSLFKRKSISPPTTIVTMRWDVSNVENMSSMFENAQFTPTAIANWNVSKVVNMKSMFKDAQFTIPSLSWNVEQVKDMSSMFKNVKNASWQDLKDWNVSNVENMSSMFEGTVSTVNHNRNFVDFSSWNTTKVTKMRSMFKKTKLYTFNIEKWDVGNVTDMRNMFKEAVYFDQSLINWNVEKLVGRKGSYAEMFKGATSFNGGKNADYVSGTNYVDPEKYFLKLKAAGELDFAYPSPLVLSMNNSGVWKVESKPDWTLSGRLEPGNVGYTSVDINLDNLIKRDGELNSTTLLPRIVENNLPPSTVKVLAVSADDQRIYEGEFTLKIKIKATNSTLGRIVDYAIQRKWKDWNLIDTSEVTDMSNLFNPSGNSYLNSNTPIGNIENWDVSNVLYMQEMFRNNRKFDQNINNWVVSKVQNMSSMFYNSSFKQNIDRWDTGQVTNMRAMFQNTSFNHNIDRWNTENVQDMSSMFRNNASFNQTLNSWKTGKVKDMSFMFANARTFNQALDSWNTGQVTDMRAMFQNASAFNQPLYNWNTGQVKDMRSMFQNAVEFNGTLYQSSPYRRWDTSQVTNMSSMFDGATDFNQYLPWSTQKVTDMSYMFRNAKNYDQHTYFNAQEVTNMSYMFYGNTNRNKDVPYNVDKVQNMSYMFYGNSSWDDNNSYSSQLRYWDTDNVENMSHMFEGATLFNSSNIRGWDVSKVTNMSYMFYGASNFNQSLNSWEVDKVENMSYMFYNASKFNQPLDSWEVDNVKNMQGMFYIASQFDRPLNSWDVGSVEDMSWMFYSAYQFDRPLNSWNVGNVRTMRGMFYGAYQFNQPLNSWVVDKVENMSYMFYDASQFDYPLDNWNVDKVENMYGMFSGASQFDQPLNSWNVGNVRIMGEMFRNASQFDYPLDNWNVDKVENMYRMFRNASQFNQPLNSWNVGNVRIMDEMFRNASKFDKPLDNWDVINVTSMYRMFSGASNFDKPLDNWDVINVTNMYQMFYNARKFKGDIRAWKVCKASERTDNDYRMDTMFNGAIAFNNRWNNGVNYTNPYSYFNDLKNNSCPN